MVLMFSPVPLEMASFHYSNSTSNEQSFFRASEENQEFPNVNYHSRDERKYIIFSCPGIHAWADTVPVSKDLVFIYLFIYFYRI